MPSSLPVRPSTTRKSNVIFWPFAELVAGAVADHAGAGGGAANGLVNSPSASGRARRSPSPWREPWRRRGRRSGTRAGAAMPVVSATSAREGSETAHEQPFAGGAVQGTVGSVTPKRRGHRGAHDDRHEIRDVVARSRAARRSATRSSRSTTTSSSRPDMFEGRLPAQFADRAPRIVENERGTRSGSSTASATSRSAMNAVVGRKRET